MEPGQGATQEGTFGSMTSITFNRRDQILEDASLMDTPLR